MTNKSPSSDEGWSVVARELSDIPGWEKLTYANGIVEERPIPITQLELFSLKKAEFDLISELTEVVSDTQVEINPELLSEESTKPTPGIVNHYYPGKRKVAYFRFSYRVGKRVKHKHIRGGNVFSQAGQANAQRIRDMVNQRCSLGEILRVINSF